MAESDEPKIIIDSDWKQQAQAEKERLAEASKATEQAQPGAGELPEASFEELLRLLASQAVLYLGSRDPQTGQVMVSLELSKFNIDLLAMLEEKTKGNLSEEESRLMSQMLSELRLVYADTSKAVAQAMQEGKVARPAGGGTPPSAAE